jgi:hypothetical protein
LRRQARQLGRVTRKKRIGADDECIDLSWDAERCDILVAACLDELDL